MRADGSNWLRVESKTAACESSTWIALDLSAAPAHAAVANAYFLQYEVTRPDNTPNRALLDRALTHAHQACALDGSYSEAVATLGFLLTSAGDVEHARAAARRATAMDPSNWRHQFRLSVACWGQERLDAVRRTLSLLPDFAPAHLVAAMVFVARRAFPAAEKLAVKGAARQSLQGALQGALQGSLEGRTTLGATRHSRRLACTGSSACCSCATVTSRRRRRRSTAR